MPWGWGWWGVGWFGQLAGILRFLGIGVPDSRLVGWGIHSPFFVPVGCLKHALGAAAQAQEFTPIWAPYTQGSCLLEVGCLKSVGWLEQKGLVVLVFFLGVFFVKLKFVNEPKVLYIGLVDFPKSWKHAPKKDSKEVQTPKNNPYTTAN